MPVKNFVLLLFATISFYTVSAQNQDSVAVVNATQNFLSAFKSFNWPVFQNAFSPGASIFFPGWEQAGRKLGKTEIEATWTSIFPEFIDSTQKTELQIEPRDLLVQMFGNTSIVSFHLGDGIHVLSRRTIVFAKEKGEWKIVHLHASNMRKPKEE